MAWTVNMGVVAFVSFVFNVTHSNCHSLRFVTNSTTLGNICVTFCNGEILSSLNGNQGAGESGLPVVNMTNRADVHVGLCPFKRFLCHLFLDLPR